MQEPESDAYQFPYKNSSVARYPDSDELVNVVFYPSLSKLFFWSLLLFIGLSTIIIVNYPLVEFPWFGTIGSLIFWFLIEMSLLGVLLNTSFYLLEISEYYLTDKYFVCRRFGGLFSEEIQVDSIIRIDVEYSIVERICNWFIRDEVGHLTIYTEDGSQYTTESFEDPEIVYYEIYAQKVQQSFKD